MKYRNILASLSGAAAVLAASAAPALAQEAPSIDSGDTAWMMPATALVLLMTIPGLALFSGGMVRQNNGLATIMHSFENPSLVSLPWIIVGFSPPARKSTL